MVKELRLTQNKVALVDDEDFERVVGYRWYPLNQKQRDGRVRIYAVSIAKTGGKTVTTYLHRLILNAPKRAYIDHDNGNGLDNRRSNLRLCTQTQNLGNQRRSSRNSSGYKGVSIDKRSGQWQVRIGFRKQTHHLGLYADPAFAAAVYDAAARRLFGHFALTNFPTVNLDAEAIIAARFARDERIAA
jgi:hypothetical protein